MGVNFKLIIENAQKQRINLQEVAIEYTDLTEEDLKLLKNHQVITHAGKDWVLAKFPEEGMPILQSKATAVHYLGA